MSSNINFVIALARAPLERGEADVAQLTIGLGSNVLGAAPRSWLTTRNREKLRGRWPLSSRQMVERLTRGEVIAVYPRDDGSNAGGSIVWSLGERIGTATVSIPKDRYSEGDRRLRAVMSAQLSRKCGAVLCAVGSELELNDADPLTPDLIARRPDVELVAFPAEKGVAVLAGAGGERASAAAP